MAIATDSTINVDYNGIHYDSIGLSKTLNNYTIDEIKQFAYCAGDNTLFKHITEKVDNNLVVALDGVDVPVTVEQYNSTTMVANAGEPANENQGEKGAYCAVVWLSKTTSGTVDVITQNNLGLYKLITEFRAKNYVLELSNPVKINASSELQYGVDNWNGTGQTDNFPLWYNRESSLYYYSDDNGTVKIDLSSNRIYPFIMFTYNEKLYFFRLSPSLNQFYSNRNNGYENPVTASSYSSFDVTTAISVSTALEELWDVHHSNTDWNFPEDWTKTGGGMYGWGYTGNCFNTDLCMIGLVNGTNSQLYSGVKFHFYFTNKNAILDFWKCCGIKFLADKLYKPIISGGYVTGYTDNLDTPSDLDTWTGKSNHEIPSSRPSGGGGDNENEEIEMPLAYIGGTGGFVQFIKINSAGIASADDISAALSRFDITTIGKDLLRNFVSYKCFAVLNIDPNDTVTRQIKVDGHALTDENDQPLNGQIIGSVLPIDFEIGTPTRYFNDFRDYAPYTKIEAYVPFCGWFSLPSWCIGHKITGTMFTDLYNGTVKAVIFAGSTVVAEIGGCCAYDIPFVADATGAKAGAVISSALSTAAATAATVTMPNVATGIAAVTSAANTLSALNSNDTTLKGVLGDGSNLNGLLHCYLKITRPQSPTRTKEIPNAYKHEFGIPTYKELTLATGDGYTQIMDAKIEGNMTDREKQMIIEGFRHGLIL